MEGVSLAYFDLESIFPRAELPQHLPLILGVDAATTTDISKGDKDHRMKVHERIQFFESLAAGNMDLTDLRS